MKVRGAIIKCKRTATPSTSLPKDYIGICLDPVLVVENHLLGPSVRVAQLPIVQASTYEEAYDALAKLIRGTVADVAKHSERTEYTYVEL